MGGRSRDAFLGFYLSSSPPDLTLVYPNPVFVQN